MNCYHGGTFYDIIGNRFEHIERRKDIINADSLDAWFDPTPTIKEKLCGDNFDWTLRTSPPIRSDGLINTIADVRNINKECILANAGSSNNIFLTLLNLADKDSTIINLNPTYGEYNSIFKNIIKCEVKPFELHSDNNFKVNIDKLCDILKTEKYTMITLVNPNSPTGQVINNEDMERICNSMKKNTLLWVDEAYLEYSDNVSLEKKACNSDNLIISKSMSKMYALSGMRVAYLVSNKKIIDKLKVLTPPWAVSLPAQIAATCALTDLDYYKKQWELTHTYREELIKDILENNDVEIVPSIGNFFLVKIPEKYNITSTEIVDECRKDLLFLRNIGSMGGSPYSLRITVKDKETNKKISQIFTKVYNSLIS